MGPDQMYKVIVAGSRTITDEEFLKRSIWSAITMFVTFSLSGIEIVSGGAKGVDKYGEKFAQETGMKCTVFPADWGAHGKAAGPMRNEQMAEYADALVAIWDGESRGTKHMIFTALKCGLTTIVIRYN